jgi:hypothetical protein
LRWLLCYEESDRDVCHLQKAAPKHWFQRGEKISVAKCPTRFGSLTWTTEAIDDRNWKVAVETPAGFAADLVVHIHPPGGGPVRTSSQGKIENGRIILGRELFRAGGRITFQISG